jgi:hypothetical protein
LSSSLLVIQIVKVRKNHTIKKNLIIIATTFILLVLVIYSVDWKNKQNKLKNNSATNGFVAADELRLNNQKEKSENLLSLVLTFQSVSDAFANERSSFLKESVDEKLRNLYVVNGDNDIALMRYLGTKGLNGLQISNLHKGVEQLKNYDKDDSFSGSTRLAMLSYDFLNNFYTKISNLRTFEEFKIDVVDFQSFSESSQQAKQVFTQEYNDYKNKNPDLDYSSTDNIFVFINDSEEKIHNRG